MFHSRWNSMHCLVLMLILGSLAFGSATAAAYNVRVNGHYMRSTGGPVANKQACVALLIDGVHMCHDCDLSDLSGEYVMSFWGLDDLPDEVRFYDVQNDSYGSNGGGIFYDPVTNAFLWMMPTIVLDRGDVFFEVDFTGEKSESGEVKSWSSLKALYR